MMRITRIEPVTKTKYRVSVDEQFAFVVYKGESSQLQRQSIGYLLMSSSPLWFTKANRASYKDKVSGIC